MRVVGGKLGADKKLGTYVSTVVPGGVAELAGIVEGQCFLLKLYSISPPLPGSILSVESNQNVESKTKNVESKIAFGQLIIRKIIKTVATRCQILSLKCTKIQILAGAPPQTSLEELTALAKTP